MEDFLDYFDGFEANPTPKKELNKPKYPKEKKNPNILADLLNDDEELTLPRKNEEQVAYEEELLPEPPQFDDLDLVEDAPVRIEDAPEFTAEPLKLKPVESTPPVEFTTPVETNTQFEAASQSVSTSTSQLTSAPVISPAPIVQPLIDSSRLTGADDVLKVNNKEIKAAENKLKKRSSKTVQHTLLRVGVYSLLVALVGVGIYNAVKPAENLSKQEVETIAANLVKDGGYPTAAASEYAKEVIRLIITTDGGNKQQNTNYAEQLNGLLPQGVNYLNTPLISGPSLVKVKVIDAHNAQFTYRVELDLKEENKVKTVLPSYVSTNVNYDKGVFTLSSGLSFMPAAPVGNNSELPNAANLSPDGKEQPDSQLTAEVTPTVQAFIKSMYQEEAGSDVLQQLWVKGTDKKLMVGYHNGMTVDSVQVDAWKQGEDTALVSAQVRATINGAVKPLTVTSQYSIILKEIGGKWLVEKLLPFRYQPQPVSK